MDLETLDLIKKLLNRRLDNVKTNLIYNVDDEKQLMYHRGQIKSLEDLQQDIKDLLNKQEQQWQQSPRSNRNGQKVLRKLLDRLPNPTGYRLLVLPYAGPKKTKGGLILADTTHDTIQMTTVCGLVLKMGPLCYRDKEKFPFGKWCEERQWVIFGRYAGSRFKIDGGEVRILNDDEIIAQINNPADILHAY